MANFGRHLLFFLGPRFHSVCAVYPGTFHSLLPQRSSRKAPLCEEVRCVTKQTKGLFLGEHPVFSALVLPAEKPSREKICDYRKYVCGLQATSFEDGIL